MTVGLLLMTQLTATTEYPVLFAWMFITGVGIGPTLSVFTIIVQNAVPFAQLGVATSNLTFFRQIGGSVGLAIAGTIFGTSLQNRLPGELVASLPEQLQGPAQAAMGSGAAAGINPNDLTGVGQSFGEALVGQLPAGAQAALAPFTANLDAGFHQAMSLSIADTFAIGIAATALALAAAVVMRELPLRKTQGAEAPVGPITDAAPRPTLRQSPATD
jgi:hypothetical protein